MNNKAKDFFTKNTSYDKICLGLFFAVVISIIIMFIMAFTGAISGTIIMAIVTFACGLAGFIRSRKYPYEPYLSNDPSEYIRKREEVSDYDYVLKIASEHSLIDSSELQLIKPLVFINQHEAGVIRIEAGNRYAQIIGITALCFTEEFVLQFSFEYDFLNDKIDNYSSIELYYKDIVTIGVTNNSTTKEQELQLTTVGGTSSNYSVHEKTKGFDHSFVAMQQLLRDKKKQK